MNATFEDIRYAYRLLLGREPDEEGNRTYREMLSKQILDTVDLSAIFLSSEEFLNRNSDRLQPVRVDLDGYSVFVRRGDNSVGYWILSNKCWEPHVERKLREILRPGMTFVDIGANVGYFTALASHLVGEAGEVIAVEPMDKNVQLIYAACHFNKSKNVSVLPYAASDKSSIVRMNDGGSTSNGNVLAGVVMSDVSGLFTRSICLDQELRNLKALDVVKFDIEGLEFSAWHGFQHSIKKFKPEVITEFHPACLRKNGEVDPGRYLKVLMEYGRVNVINMDGTESFCETASDILRSWEYLDRDLGADGGAHLDLHVRPIV